jgi:hypothetical protein
MFSHDSFKTPFSFKIGFNKLDYAFREGSCRQRHVYKEGCAIVSMPLALATPSFSSCFTKFLQKLAVHLYLF